MMTGNREAIMLDEILLDEKVSLLRDQLLDTCLQEVTRRRRVQSGHYAALAVAALVLILVALYPRSTREFSESTAGPSYRVSTSALSQTERVRTSSAVLSGLVVRTQSLSPTVYARETAKFARISNAEMLGLFPDIPCGIVRKPDSGGAFVFFRAEDRERFLAPRVAQR